MENGKNSTDDEFAHALKENNEIYSKIIAENIKKLLKSKKWSQNELCEELNRNGLSITQNTLSKYIPQKKELQPIIPISLLVLCCKIFDVSIEKITSSDYFPDQDSLSEYFSDIKELIEETNVNADFADFLAAGIAKASKKFIVNGNDEAFNGYYQTYFCYFYPTISSEIELLTAELEFKNENDICKAHLKLNTGKYKNGTPIYKFYSGLMVIIEKSKSCYCILAREKTKHTNELCFLNFRYIPIGDIHRNMDCRMVEVLTTSAGGDSSFPTAHRMFISRSPIKKEHIPFVLPHLHLNNSLITIDEEGLIKVARISDQYKEIIKKIITLIFGDNTEQLEILQKIDVIETQNQKDNEEVVSSVRRVMYLIKEDLVRNTANLCLSKQQAQIFVSTLRSCSYAFRFNKVSKKLDDNIRKMLIGLGYYPYGKAQEMEG